MSWSNCSAPSRGPAAVPSSQPDHFLLTSQPENARESVETLDPAFSAHLPPHTHLETGDKHTDKDQDWHPALVPRADNQVPDAPERRNPLLSKKLLQSQRMGTSAPWALIWMRLRPQSWGVGASAGVTLPGGGSGWPAEEGASGHCLGRRRAQARQGARVGPEAWAPSGFSINCVC